LYKNTLTLTAIVESDSSTGVLARLSIEEIVLVGVGAWQTSEVPS